jgi:hypothetical protein
VTVAVSVTLWAKAEGLIFDTSEVEEAALLTLNEAAELVTDPQAFVNTARKE